MRALAAILALAALPYPARADTLYWIGAKLPNTANDPWPFWLDNRSRASTLPTVSQSEGVITSVFQSWEAVNCAFISFTYSGQVASGPNTTDQKNVMVTFVQDKTQDNRAYDYALGGGVASAVALPLMYNGVIYDCDVAFNAVDYQWSATGTSVAGKLDLKTVALQEVGHCLGLDHYTGDRNSVMFPTVSPGEVKTQLAPHDIDNICQLYPASGGIGASCETASCSSGLTCVTDPTTSKKFCTRACNPSASDCPTGTWCKPFANPSPGACFPGNPPSIAGIGAACTDNASCGAGVCFTVADGWPGGYCSQQCTGSGGSPCPAQSTCYDDACNAQGCFCLKDCRPGYGDCRQGYTCEPLTGGKGRCRPSCASNADCQSPACPTCTCRTCDGLCLRAGNSAAQVGDACTRQEDCPVGTFCLLGAYGFPGGYCTASCYTRCTICPAGSQCLNWGLTGDPLCLRTCASPCECRADYACASFGSVKACQPGCTSELQCPVGDVCRSGRCVLPGTDDGCPKPDGGTNPPVTPGCACGTGGSIWAVLAGILVAARFRRRRP